MAFIVTKLTFTCVNWRAARLSFYLNFLLLVSRIHKERRSKWAEECEWVPAYFWHFAVERRPWCNTEPVYHILSDWLCMYCIHRTACNRTLTASTRILSPRWPNNYPQDVRCETVITTALGQKLSLFFATLDIEPHPSCDYDYLEVCCIVPRRVN